MLALMADDKAAGDGGGRPGRSRPAAHKLNTEGHMRTLGEHKQRTRRLRHGKTTAPHCRWTRSMPAPPREIAPAAGHLEGRKAALDNTRFKLIGTEVHQKPCKYRPPNTTQYSQRNCPPLIDIYVGEIKKIRQRTERVNE